MKNLKIILILFILISSSVFAISISPPELVLVYEPGEERGCGFSFKSGKSNFLSFRAEGDLKNYTRFPFEKIEVNPGEWYTFQCSLSMPENLMPGPHELNVIAIEGESEKGLGAIAGINFPVRLFVPYPGKYMEIQKYVFQDIVVNETSEFVLEVINRGKETIESAQATINIINKNEIIVAQTKSNSVRLEKDQKAELKAKLDSTGIRPGIYRAEAIVDYDEKQARTSKELRIGEIRIDILKIIYNKILTDNINKFDLNLQSIWNSPINDAYVVMEIYDQNYKQIKQIRGENFPIQPWEKITQTIYFDTKNVQPGTYFGNFTVFHSLAKASEKSLEFQVYDNLLGKYPLVTIVLILVIIILVIILLKNIKKIKKK